MQKVIIYLILIISLNAITTLKPIYTLKASGDVQDIVYKHSRLYAATSVGSIDIFNTTTKKRVQSILVPKIKDFMGDMVNSKLYSVDYLDAKILFVAQGENGYRELWLYANKNLTRLITIDKHLLIKKARFVDKNRVILGMLSNQIILYDIRSNKFIYEVQISTSSFSDFVLNEDKNRLYMSDESGIVRELDTSNGKVISIIGEKNLDKVFQLDMKNDTIITAGQDRKSVIYKDSKSYTFLFGFLLYSCALNTSATLGAIAYNEDNDILIFNVQSKIKKYTLKAHKSTLNKILFINNSELFSSAESKIINFWRIK